MINHRDSVQQTLDNSTTTDQAMRLDLFARDMKDMNDHIDRLYERYHELWEWIESLSECVASPPPAPLKYK